VLFEIPHNQDRVGLVTLSGLNPVAGAVESGIAVTNYPMSGLLDVARLRPFAELI
jgi:repressor of nif and glnA expression